MGAQRPMRDYPVRQSALARWSRRLALFGIAVVITGPLLARMGAIEPFQGLVVVASGLICSGLALVLALLAYADIWRSGATGLARANLGFLLSLATLAYPAAQIVNAFRLPVTNDVSTDLADPPGFARSRTALDGRRGYVPPEMPQQARDIQRAAYPDLAPVLLEMGPDEAFELVIEVVDKLKWRIVDRTPPSARTGSGRIDAVERTLLMNFSDDITIRLRALPNETRIDIRSVSRVGKHDLGANAARIRRFTQELNALNRG